MKQRYGGRQFPEPFPQFSARGQVAFLWPYYAQLTIARSNDLISFARLSHESWTTGINFSPDGRSVATASQDSTARIWDTKTGEPIGGPLSHAREVFMAQFRADAQQVITASADKSVRIWDPRTGQAFAEPILHDTAVYSAKMNASGQRLVTVSESDAAWLWETRTLQPLTVFRWLSASPNFMRLSPDGQWLLAGDAQDNVRVLNLRSGTFQGKRARHKQTYTISDAQFSPDGRRFVTTSEDSTAQIWDARTGEAVGPALRHERKRVVTASFSPSGEQIVTASQDHTARVWDVPSGIERLKLRHGGDVRSAGFSPDGKLIVTSSLDGTAQIWDAATGRSLSKLTHDDEVECAVFDWAGQRVATASKDRTARLWSVRTAQMLTLPLRHADALRSESVSFSPDGSRLLTMAGNSAQVWDSATGRPLIRPFRHERLVRVARFSPDGRKVLTASSDGTARLWDAETGYEVREPLRHGSRVRSAQFTPDGSRVLTCSADKAIRIWEISSAPPLLVPKWLPELAEAVAGQRIDETDVSEIVPLEQLYRLRQKLAANTDQSYYGRWARWFFADSATRTVSPSSELMVPEYVQRRIEENTLESLQEAIRLSATNSLAFARLALQLIGTSRTARPNGSEDAEWFSRYATNLAPQNPEVARSRATVVEALPRSGNTRNQ